MSSKIKKIHFVGIKGVGMAPLAIIAKEAGFDVSGSDVPEDFITKSALEKAGISNITDFSSENVDGCDLVVITAAHGGFENVEAISAKEKNIPIMTQADAVGAFSSGEIFGKEFETIAVSGSHGKTTTSAMIATILLECGLDPSYSIGTGDIPTLAGPGHFGKGKFFVCEADEYISFEKPKFLAINPNIALVTNIDFDHPDVYKDISEISSAFVNFSQKIKPDGVLIACGDGIDNKNFLKEVSCRKITYGFSSDNDYVLDKISTEGGRTYFWIKFKDSYIGQFSINIFGEQNALDALGAIIVSLEAGLSIEKIKPAISKYSGSRRRSEFIGETENGALIYDDYAHHPSEISNTLDSFRKNFIKKKIVVVFQPHMYSRTKLLYEDFVKSFDKADCVIISEIFPSFREEKDPNYSASLITEGINKRKIGKSIFIEKLSDVVKYLDEKNFGKDTLIITMGAGDVYKINSQICKNSL